MAGNKTFIKQRKIAASKATKLGSPILDRKNIEAPSLIPISANEIEGIMLFTNITKLPAQK